MHYKKILLTLILILIFSFFIPLISAGYFNIQQPNAGGAYCGFTTQSGTGNCGGFFGSGSAGNGCGCYSDGSKVSLWCCEDSSSGYVACRVSGPSTSNISVFIGGYINTTMTCNAPCQASAEICDGRDNDCDGAVDEGVKTTFYKDLDADTYGNLSVTTQACTVPSGYSIKSDDCNDSNPQIYPSKAETCDGIDNDCDTTIDEGFDCVKGSTNCNSDCSFATRRINSCIGTIPTNAEQNYGSTEGKYLEKWNGTKWITLDNNTYRHNNETNECSWKCNTGYVYVSSTNTCETDFVTGQCTGSIESNSEWNDNGNNGTFSYLRDTTPPVKSAHYSEAPEDCAYKCKTNFHREGSTCVSNEKLIPCNLSPTNTLPENAKWNSPLDQNFKQTWTNNAWTPTTKNAYYSENTNECAYSCLELTKTCQPDPTTYCGIGQKDCNKGYWTMCRPTQANICTTNQYCENNSCNFCAEGKKNCDSNLLNGCETNIQTDNNNCGYCDNNCAEGFICIKGTCSTMTPDTNLCEDQFCGSNSTCDSNTGNCNCEPGYFDCDGLSTNGCEKNTTCNFIPGLCSNDSNCETGKICSNGACIVKPVEQPEGYCKTDTDCISSEACLNSRCETVVCGENFSVVDHKCSCTGKICQDICYFEKGVCCRNNWNLGIDSCEFETESIAIVVDASKDSEAIELLEEAKNSINTGEITKGQAQAITAELKALIETKNQTQYNEKYQEALLAIEEEDYETAKSIALETKEAILKKDNESGFFLTIIILIVLAIVGAFIYFKFKDRLQNTD